MKPEFAVQAAVAALMTLALSSCLIPPDSIPGVNSILGLDSEIDVGLVDRSAPRDSMFQVPDTADVGADFTVTVWTAPDGCISAWDTYLVTESQAALVVPVDRYDLTVSCLDVEWYALHESTVRFLAAGPATVTLRARDLRTTQLFEWVDTVWVR